MTSLRILGPIQVVAEERPLPIGGRRQIALLAYLLLHANTAVSSDALIDAVWGSIPGVDNRLHMAITRLRRVLTAVDGSARPELRSFGGGYMLTVSAGELDAQVFETGLVNGRQALASGLPAQATELLRDALALWRGPPLAEVAFEDFAQPEIRRLEELRLTAIEGRIDAELQLGRHASVIGELEALAAAHPSREHIVDQLMLALYRSGRQADALDAYQRVRAHLTVDLGLEPGPALRARQAQILEQAPDLDRLRGDGEPEADQQAADARNLRVKNSAARSPGRASRSESTRIPLPTKVSSAGPKTYVGRVAEFELVKKRWNAVRNRMRHGILLSGEPGIGKTQFCLRVARKLHASGAIVLYGHCREALAAPYGVWIETLSPFVEHAPDRVLNAYVEQHGSGLVRIVPALTRRLDRDTVPIKTDPESERYLLFTAVVGLLEHASSIAPVVLVLEDLHWADSTTCSLLKHVVAESGHLRMLLLATYRDTEVAREHPLTQMLADLRREERMERLRLDGLDESEILALTESTVASTGHEARVALARDLAAESGGNPFFVCELLRHVSDRRVVSETAGASGGNLALPQSVREVVLRRVDRLGEGCRRALGCAAVIGSRFDFDLLARTLRCEEDELLDLLEAAVAASLLDERVEPGDSFSFAHDLIYHVLYDVLGATRRARIHRSVAEALEDLGSDYFTPRVEELAHHWIAAAPPDPAKAFAYSCQAGEQALTKLAPDEAVGWFERALELSRQRSSPDRSQLCEITIRLGESLQQAGRPEFRATLLMAALLADDLHDPDRMARAAIANSRGFASLFGKIDQDRVSVLERAVEMNRSVNPARCARLLSLQAMELQFDDDHRRRRALADEALALTQLAPTDANLPYILRDHFHATWSVDTLDARRATAARMTELAASSGDPLARMWALDRSFHVAVEAGALTEAAETLGLLRTVTDQLRRPALRWPSTYYASGLAMSRGDLKQAEELAEAAVSLGEQSSEPDAAFLYFGQICTPRLEQLRAAEIVELLQQAAADNPTVPAFAAAAAVVLCELGRNTDARRSLDAHAGQKFADLPLNQVYSSALALWAVVAANVGSQPAAAALYDLLEPWHDQFIWNGATGYGSAQSYLGMLAATLGSHARAHGHFTIASQLHRRQGVKLWEAWNLRYFAESLLASGATADALKTAERALSVAQANDFAATARRAADLINSASTAGHPTQ
jgi:DNA-binding SARP family transcriptional activator/DNA polymerase III delta prime subunit